MCRKAREYAQEFAPRQWQKRHKYQRFNSWRRERDSNYESGSPYPFEKSSKFSTLGTREGPRRAGIDSCMLWLCCRGSTVNRVAAVTSAKLARPMPVEVAFVSDPSRPFVRLGPSYLSV